MTFPYVCVTCFSYSIEFHQGLASPQVTQTPTSPSDTCSKPQVPCSPALACPPQLDQTNDDLSKFTSRYFHHWQLFAPHQKKKKKNLVIWRCSRKAGPLGNEAEIASRRLRTEMPDGMFTRPLTACLSRDRFYPTCQEGFPFSPPVWTSLIPSGSVCLLRPEPPPLQN